MPVKMWRPRKSTAGSARSVSSHLVEALLVHAERGRLAAHAHRPALDLGARIHAERRRGPARPADAPTCDRCDAPRGPTPRGSRRCPRARAASSSASVLPGPANRMRSGGQPAARAWASSPAEATSRPAPLARNSAQDRPIGIGLHRVADGELRRQGLPEQASTSGRAPRHRRRRAACRTASAISPDRDPADAGARAPSRESAGR